MGQYDYLVPSKSSDTATAPTSNRYASLIPASAAPKSSPVSSTPNYAPSLYDQVNPPPEKSPQLPSYVPFADAINFLVPLAKTEIKGAIEGFNETPSAPKTTDFVAGIGGGMGKAAGDAFQSGVDALSAQVPKGNAIERGAFIGDNVVKTINATFGVALSALQGYATVPIVGNVIDGVNKVFGAISKGASAGAELEVNKLPVSQETKDAILPFAKDSAALAAQMVAGKIAGDFTKTSFLKLTDNSKAILTQLQNDPVIRDSIAKQTAGPIQVPIKSETSGAPTPLRINTPTTKHTDYATSQGYEPIVPDNQLPVIQMGAKPKSDISTVSSETAPNVAHEALPADTRFKALSPEDQTTVRTMQRSLFGKGMDWNSAGETALARFEGQKGGSSAPLTMEPINEPSVIPEKTNISPTIKNESPKPVKSPIQPETIKSSKVVPEAPTSVSTIASRNEAINKPVKTGGEITPSKGATIDNMQEHLSPVEFQQFKQATSHEKANQVEQANKAANFVHDYPERADNIIFKGEHPPEGIRTQDVFTEARIKALSDYRAGKVPLDTYLKYAKADELLGSRTGSELGARANRFDENDPAAWLAKARENLQGSNIKYATERVVSEAKRAKATITKTATRMVDYNKILESITC